MNILPCVAGYVGSDITADVLAAVPEDGGQWLLLDIGTNGEMLLGNAKDGYVCCATAAGPAFEGAEITMGMPAADGAIASVTYKNHRLSVGTIGEKDAVGICGSGLLDALAVFLEAGLMDESGMLMEVEEVPEELRGYIGTYEGQPCVWLSEKVCVTQEDVRNLQLAKAAIAAGIEILLKEKAFGYKDVTGVWRWIWKFLKYRECGKNRTDSERIASGYGSGRQCSRRRRGLCCNLEKGKRTSFGDSRQNALSGVIHASGILGSLYGLYSVYIIQRSIKKQRAA